MDDKEAVDGIRRIDLNVPANIGDNRARVRYRHATSPGQAVMVGELCFCHSAVCRAMIVALTIRLALGLRTVFVVDTQRLTHSLRREWRQFDPATLIENAVTGNLSPGFHGRIAEQTFAAPSARNRHLK